MMLQPLTPNVAARVLAKAVMNILGGKGSGNFGHEGRPGARGGSTSAGESAADSLKEKYGSLVPASEFFDRVDENARPEVLGAMDAAREQGIQPAERTLPMDALVAIQDDIQIEGVRSYVRTEGDRIDVAKFGNKFYVIDGYHRTAAEKLRGRRIIKARVYDLDKELKNLGGRGSGNFSHGGRPGERGGSTSSGGTEKVRNERSLRALKHFIPVHAESQRHAERNELSVRKMVGGERTDDNKPVDVITTIDGKIKGIEVKTMINNTNDKITVRKAALLKKAAWARSNHATVHTVVIDDRGKFGHKSYSGHRIYHTKGTGSFRLSTLTKVRDAKHLKELLAK